MYNTFNIEQTLITPTSFVGLSTHFVFLGHFKDLIAIDCEQLFTDSNVGEKSPLNLKNHWVVAKAD